MKTKTCSKCNTELLLSSFGPRKGCKDGVNTICRVCASKKSLAYYHANEHVKKRQNALQKTPKHRERKRLIMRRIHDRDPQKAMLDVVKRRSVKQGRTFALVSSDIVIPEVCPCCSVKLVRGDKRVTTTSPSVDRIENSKGYLPDNIWVICNRCNMLKGDASPVELRRIADAVDRRLQCQ